jgi:hypothetical protein
VSLVFALPSSAEVTIAAAAEDDPLPALRLEYNARRERPVASSVEGGRVDAADGIPSSCESIVFAVFLFFCVRCFFFSVREM